MLLTIKQRRSEFNGNRQQNHRGESRGKHVAEPPSVLSGSAVVWTSGAERSLYVAGIIFLYSVSFFNYFSQEKYLNRIESNMYLASDGETFLFKSLTLHQSLTCPLQAHVLTSGRAIVGGRRKMAPHRSVVKSMSDIAYINALNNSF